MPRVVMISSTSLDLPEHRQEVLQACLAQGYHPLMMEHLSAGTKDAKARSLRMVDQADVYLGIFANRYGYIPEGEERSLTHMEYERACARNIERLIFIVHPQHAPIPLPVESAHATAQLQKLKDQLQTAHVVAFFRSPHDLRAHVVNALSQLARPRARKYVAHPYALMRTRRLIGRRKELGMLTDWAKSDVARVCVVEGIGGLGKSALTWEWFNNAAPEILKPLDGQMWWSFYESGATFENFVIRALAYVTDQKREQVLAEYPYAAEREGKLWEILNERPFLLALDGLERMLVAYARPDAARLADEEVPPHVLRKTADDRAGQFLRSLARLEASRVLISTRLMPMELETPGHKPLHGCAAHVLGPLCDEDALELWHSFGVKGSPQHMLPFFHTFENHPLLLQILAGSVADFHDAPGDFDAWRSAKPSFNPFALRLEKVRTQILEYALADLTPPQSRALHVLAGFRAPVSRDTLTDLLVRSSPADDVAKKPFADGDQRDACFANLHDRGLVGIDGATLDLHPIVRGVVWARVRPDDKRDINDTLRQFFDAIPKKDLNRVNTLEDLTPALELYHTLVELERYDDAYQLFRDRLDDALYYRLGAARIRQELLVSLAPTQSGKDCLVSKKPHHALILHALAKGAMFNGHPGDAVRFFCEAHELIRTFGEDVISQPPLEVKFIGKMCSFPKPRDLESIVLSELTHAHRLSGHLRAADEAGRNALARCSKPFERGVTLYRLGLAQATRGAAADARASYQESLAVWQARPDGDAFTDLEGFVHACLAQLALWEGNLDAADREAKAASAFFEQPDRRFQINLIQRDRLTGTILLARGDLDSAHELLNQALTQAHACGRVEEELLIVPPLADWHRRTERRERARELLQDVWEPAERGPYPAFHADARLVLASIEADDGNHAAAVQEATHAFRLAWCDGPPCAYHWGLTAARQLLTRFGAAEPAIT